MFSLLYGFWQALFRKVEFHILILGLDRAGKTSLLEQLNTYTVHTCSSLADQIHPCGTAHRLNPNTKSTQSSSGADF